MAFIVTPPNKPGHNDVPSTLVDLYGTIPGSAFAHFMAVPEDGGVPPPPGGGESSYAYQA